MKKEKISRILKIMVWLLAGIFIVLMSYLVFPDKYTTFSFIAVLAFVFCLSGIVLIFLTLKGKFKGKQKVFLLLTGISSAGILVFSVLHNLFYALAIVFEHIPAVKYLMEILHAASFIIAIPLCPIGFLIGAIGSIVLFMRKR